MNAPRMDRDAILEALQDQIDDLTATVTDQQRILDVHATLIIELARLAGVGDSTAAIRRARPRPDRGGGDG